MKKQIIGDNLTKALLQLSLTEKEIATYTILLQNGPMSAQEISRGTGINRVSIYAGIDELKAKGLLSESRKGKKKLFVAENPESLKIFLEGKKEKLTEEEALLENIILPTLKVFDISEKKHPQIKFFEGVEGLNKIYDEYVLKSNDVFNCGSYEVATKVISEKWEEEYISIIKKKNIFYRMILEDTQIDRKFAKLAKGVMHAKFFPPNVKVPGDIIVFGSSVALMSYDKKTATLIEDETIAKTIKTYLEFMWEKL